MIGGAWLPLGSGGGEVTVDPVSNLSSYGLAGTFLAIMVIAAATLYRGTIKSRDQERASWEQQRLDLVARIDQANGRADRAEEKRDEAIKANQRAVEQMHIVAETTSGKGMEVLQRALTAVAESAAREKAAQDEIQRMRQEMDRLSRALDRGRE